VVIDRSAGIVVDCTRIVKVSSVNDGAIVVDGTVVVDGTGVANGAIVVNSAIVVDGVANLDGPSVVNSTFVIDSGKIVAKEIADIDSIIIIYRTAGEVVNRARVIYLTSG